MATFEFDTIDQLNAVMAQLPAEARTPDSGIKAEQLDDGRWALTAPDQWDADVAAADPDLPVPAKRTFTFLEFMALFTDDETDAIVDSTNTQVKLFLLMAAGASYIDLDDPRTPAGLDLLVGQGLISSVRKAAVLAGQGPG